MQLEDTDRAMEHETETWLGDTNLMITRVTGGDTRCHDNSHNTVYITDTMRENDLHEPVHIVDTMHKRSKIAHSQRWRTPCMWEGGERHRLGGHQRRTKITTRGGHPGGDT